MRLLALLLVLARPAVPAVAAEEVVLGLSDDEVGITATFDGSDILVFGAVRGEPPSPDAAPRHVVVAVSGPLRPATVRRAERRWGLWLNVDAVAVDAAPVFYAVASTAPLDAILSDTEDLRHSITLPRAVRAIGNAVAPEDFVAALLRVRAAQGLYLTLEGAVDLAEQTLFRTEIRLPANLVEGTYAARIFLLREGRVVDALGTSIAVRKVGLERWVHALSRERPAAYGLLALALAILAGWAASAAFRAARG